MRRLARAHDRRTNLERSALDLLAADHLVEFHRELPNLNAACFSNFCEHIKAHALELRLTRHQAKHARLRRRLHRLERDLATDLDTRRLTRARKDARRRNTVLGLLVQEPVDLRSRDDQSHRIAFERCNNRQILQDRHARVTAIVPRIDLQLEHAHRHHDDSRVVVGRAHGHGHRACACNHQQSCENSAQTHRFTPSRREGRSCVSFLQP